MLRITVDQDGGVCRLKLAGRLGGLWVPELENAWCSALGSAPKEIEIDLRELTSIDDEGRKLLASMHQAGARLIARGVEMTALVEELAGRQNQFKQGR